MKQDQPTTPAAAPRISEKELRRRTAAYEARGISRIAGPDHPIYKGGLQMTSLRIIQAEPPQQDEK